ncbi:MAG: patatin-like phospholipase family protein [Candidatus Marinimicrobia bacterium]|jgi:predicted acylesterase/phospholipase RssA|nr:patatin-like phospholipase family protein [Candidatus Neomarinimicrobiota bacterium]
MVSILDRLLTRYRFIASYIILIFTICLSGSSLLSQTATRPKIGLALSGGGAMGFAHIGTLKLLDSLDIPIDYIAGTSMGGIAAALYAVGYTGQEIEQIAREADWAALFNDAPSRQVLPYFQKQDADKYQFEFGIRDFRPVDKGGVIAGQKITLFMTRLVLPYLTVNDFDSLMIPFRCIAVDLTTGSEVVLERGSLPIAMRATMAVPSVFSPVDWGDSLLVDGGLLNNLPVSAVRNLGADYVIAAMVRNPFKTKEELRTTIDVLAQTFNIFRENKLDFEAKDADLLVICQLEGLSPTDFSTTKVTRIIDQGNVAAYSKLDELLALKQKYKLSRSGFIKPSTVDSLAGNRIGRITIKGNRMIPLIAIRSIIGVEEGDFYHPDTLAIGLARLKALGDYNRIRSTIETLSDSTIEVKIDLVEEVRAIIQDIEVRGNVQLTDEFILRSLGIMPGEIFSMKRIETQIDYLYGLGYFKNVNYATEPAGENNITLILNVTEHTPQKLRFGFRYDDYHYLVAALDFQTTSTLIRGLRFDAEWQFIGLNQLRIKTLYPSRRLNVPFYPFFNITYKEIPTFAYSINGNKIASYIDRSGLIGIGWGMLYKNYWNVELELNYESVNIKPEIAPEEPLRFYDWNDEIYKVQFASNIDLLDNAFMPRKGMLVHAGYERTIPQVGSHANYTRFELSGDFYHSIRRHTFRLSGYYGYANMWDGFTNRFVYRGGPETFVGVEYDQLVGSEITTLRCDYAYNILHNLQVKAIANVALGFRNRFHETITGPHHLLGYGIGLKYLSPIGPVELITGWGDKSVFQPGEIRSVGYFRAGFLF